MNYITRLQADLTSAQAEAAAKAEAMQDFRTHLASDKFAGPDPDGSRRDWIAVATCTPGLATSPRRAREMRQEASPRFRRARSRTPRMSRRS
jgi:hypothetical protein